MLPERPANENPTIIGDSLNPAGLCLVHATHFMPTLNETGNVCVHSAYSATGGEKSLHTVHFTLNHKVGAHGSGSWDDTPYAVVAPFQQAVQANGAPATLNTIDTFWPTNARDPMELPDAMLIFPAKAPTALVTRQGNHIAYKAKDFTQQDEDELRSAFGDRGLSWHQMSEAVDPQQREAALRAFSQEYAINHAIKQLGFAVEPGSGWGWARKDYSYHHADELAQTIGAQNTLPHWKTEYATLWKTMSGYLNVADYCEARVNIQGKTLTESDGSVGVYDKHGQEICREDGQRLSVVSENIDESLERFRQSAQTFDPKTQAVVADFSDKILARVTYAKSLEPEPIAAPMRGSEVGQASVNKTADICP